jgi:hypothetical protein
MNDIFTQYLKNDFGEIGLPTEEAERIELARALFGYSIVNRLDYWLDIAKDLLESDAPKQPFLRDNAASRKDKAFREVFSKMDAASKEAVLKLLNTTATGLVFSMLTNLDQFDFGQLSLTLQPKSAEPVNIPITTEEAELHEELAVWVYKYSKFKADLVEKQESSLGTSYALK